MASHERNGVAWALFAAGAIAVSYSASQFAIDLSVYHPITRYLFAENGPIFGEASGLPWPMWYRYPPLFLFLFWPFSLLSFALAAFVWTLLKFAALAWLFFAIRRRCPADPSPAALLGAAALAGPYLYSELRHANVQFFIVALVAAALLVGKVRPIFAGGLLGLGIAVKVWPLFFVPYAFAARARRMALAALPAAALFTALPALYFGPSEYLGRLAAWWTQEATITARAGAMWFPSQSLYGALSRYLTLIDYSQLPDPNYAAIHIVTWDPAVVTYLWFAAVAALYAALLLIARRIPPDGALALHGAAFCALLLLEPYAQRQSALAVLVVPALAAAGYVSTGRERAATYLFAAAATLSILQPLMGGYQRWFLVTGVDTLTTALTFACLLTLALRTKEESADVDPPPDHDPIYDLPPIR